MLNTEDSLLIIIDIQEKLLKAACESEKIASNVVKMAKASNILSVPVIVTEQYPKGLGETVSVLKDALASDVCVIEKTSFSALSEGKFKDKIDSFNKKQVLICGIETHICVLQTALDLHNAGYDVYILADCSSSRQFAEHNTAVELLKQYNIKIVSTEIVLFEWLKTSKHPKFKEIQALIK